MWKKKSSMFFLTSGSRVRWRVDRWGIRSMQHGRTWYVIGVEHISSTLRKPAGREERFSASPTTRHYGLKGDNSVFVDDGAGVHSAPANETPFSKGSRSHINKFTFNAVTAASSW